MKKYLVLIGLSIFALSILFCQGGNDGKQKVKVLLAANPDTTRAEAFMDFLGEHFATVGQVPYEEFKPSDAEGYDVIIFDGGLVVIADNSIKAPKAPEIPDDFSRPTILIGGPATSLAQKNFNSKISWL